MANRLAGVTIDCNDPTRLASFWSALLGRAITDQHSGTFQAVPEPKGAKVRLHLDVQVDDIDSGRRQVEELGGRCTGERHEYDVGVVLVMADPEGNEFCLVQHC